MEEWQEPLLQAQLGVPWPKGCPEGGSENPDPVELVGGHWAGTPLPCSVQQQAGGGLVGPWMEAEVCSRPLCGLSLTNLLHETWCSIPLPGGHHPPRGGPAACQGAELQKESGGTAHHS